MRIPVTDAFADTDQLKSLEVELTSEQIEWLQKKADERDLSPDDVLRSVITAQMQSQSEHGEEPPVPSVSGDGQPSASSDSTNDTTDEANDDESSSIVDSLRSASERLQDLTEQDDDAETPDPHDTLERLQARIGDASDENEADDNQDSYVVENQDRSMFDMMEDE